MKEKISIVEFDSETFEARARLLYMMQLSQRVSEALTEGRTHREAAEKLMIKQEKVTAKSNTLLNSKWWFFLMPKVYWLARGSRKRWTNIDLYMKLNGNRLKLAEVLIAEMDAV